MTTTTTTTAGHVKEPPVSTSAGKHQARAYQLPEEDSECTECPG